jgi:two-component system, LytTR family, sensor kinase
MNYYSFIFSDKWSYRAKRHLSFWLAVFLYHFIRISIIFPPNGFWENIISILLGALLWGTLVNIIICYSVAYYLVPKFFFKKKYILFAVNLLLLYFIIFFVGSINNIINVQMMHVIDMTKQWPFILIKASSIRLLGNPPLICGLFLSVKTMKNWYSKQKENEILVRENINAELQLLKAQIHPHFLFNTLNNIYSFTISKSQDAAALVEKLADTLHYMITDCNAVLVPVEKELKMIKDYMGLEKIRYGKQFRMVVETHGDYQNKLIAPLLIIPFVENSFKHGTSQVLADPWIKLNVSIKENSFVLEISNSKPSQLNFTNKKNGIGLQNVKKRLQLLYHSNYELNIDSTADAYFVYLKVPLQQDTSPVNFEDTKIFPDHKSSFYA